MTHLKEQFTIVTAGKGVLHDALCAIQIKRRLGEENLVGLLQKIHKAIRRAGGEGARRQDRPAIPTTPI